MSNEPATDPKVEILHSAVEAFRRREVSFRDILEDLPAAIYTTDSEGRITYYNKACVAFSGRTPALGTDLWCVTWKLLTPDGQPLPHADCPMAVALKEARAVRGVEAMAERPDGTRISFMPYPTPIFDEAGALIGAVNMLVDVTEQKKAEELMRLMAREIDHRANNLLAVTQSLVTITKADTVEGYKRALEGRLTALAKVNSLISRGRWQTVDLRTLIEDELRPFTDNVSIKGVALEVGPSAAQCFAMLIHELAANALKYGSLSTSAGSVAIAWALDQGGNMMFRWTERGGPKVCEPTQTGTGSSVITAAVRRLGGEIFRDWAPAGLNCAFVCQAGRLDLEADRPVPAGLAVA